MTEAQIQEMLANDNFVDQLQGWTYKETKRGPHTRSIYISAYYFVFTVITSTLPIQSLNYSLHLQSRPGLLITFQVLDLATCIRGMIAKEFLQFFSKGLVV